MDRSTEETLTKFAWPMYAIAFLLIATPALDFVSNVWPIRVGDVQWRYGAVGLLAAFMLTPVFGIVFALGSAVLLDHRMVVRVLSIVNIVAAILLITTTLLFALDVLQLRAGVDPEARSVFDVGAAKAAVKHLMLVPALGWLGWVGIRVSKKSSRGKRDSVPLVARRSKSEGTGSD